MAFKRDVESVNNQHIMTKLNFYRDDSKMNNLFKNNVDKSNVDTESIIKFLL
jgi:hypothetical protein